MNSMNNDNHSTYCTTHHKLVICEKPSVAKQFSHALNVSGSKDGYIENDEYIITWAVGHLITLAEPQAYDEKYSKWDLDLLPIMPERYKYQVISAVSKQYRIVKGLLNRPDVTVIYNAGDSGREGEYIQRLIFNMAGVENKKTIKRVWIDSQTDAEIIRGIREAKDESYYNCLSEAGYARAISDWLIGMNFTRALSKKFSYELNKTLGITDYKKWARLNVGRVMTCVLGLVVDRENEIKSFVPLDYYKIDALCDGGIKAQWKAVEGTHYYESDVLYNDSGFVDEGLAQKVVKALNKKPVLKVTQAETKTEKKKAPLLYSLAELQSECTKKFKISPDQTLEIAQSLYEKKMTTYPRTDARVLSTPVSKEIITNLNGLYKNNVFKSESKHIIDNEWYKGIEKTRYCDDKKITDHYAIIPTGEYIDVTGLERDVYELIVKRFLSIFFPAAEYTKTAVEFTHITGEKFFAAEKHLIKKGFLDVLGVPKSDGDADDGTGALAQLKKGESIDTKFVMATSTTQPPKRYTSGSMILAMENAGNLIEDEELRAQIKGSGIGTSATRAEVIRKLTEDVHHLKLDKKTQILTPTDIGYGVYDIVKKNVPKLLSPKMTASWEKGLTQIENGTITRPEYMEILNKFIIETVSSIKKASAQQGDVYKKVESKVIGSCPICGGKLLESEKAIFCKNRVKEKQEGCHFMFGKTLGGKPLAKEYIDELINGQSTGLIKNIPNKSGTGVYDCYIVIKEDGSVKIKYPSEESTLKCPKCGNTMEKGKLAYQCECGMNIWNTVSGRALSEEELSSLFSDMILGPLSGFKSKEGFPYSAYLLFNGKELIQIKTVISGRTISIEEVIALLEDGKTGKLDGFKGSKGEFSAVLKIGKKGYVEFEFPKKAKTGRKGASNISLGSRKKKSGAGIYKRYGIRY